MFCRTLFEIGDKPLTLFIRLPVFNAAEDDFLFAFIVENGDVRTRLYVDVSLIVKYLYGILCRRGIAVELYVQRALFHLSARLFVHIDIVVFGIVLKHFAEVGILVQSAVHELYIAVGIFFDERYLVRYHHDEFGLGDLFENVHDLHGVFRIEVTRRLVGENDIRALDERAGDCYALFLSAGERVALFVFEPLHIYEPQDFFAPPRYFAFILKARDMHGIAHDLGDGIAFFKVIILKDKSCLFIADLINFARNIFAVDINFAFVLLIQTAYNVE